MRRELGAFETAQVVTGDYAPFNAVIAVRLAAGPPVDALAAALAALQRHHGLLAAKVVREGRRMWFETGDVPTIPLEVTARTSGVDWLAVVERELNRAIDTRVGPLVRCSYLVPQAEAGSELVLTFHHSVMDSVAGSTLLRQLLGLCGGSSPDDLGLPPAGTLPPAADELYPPRARGGRRAVRVGAFMLRQLADEAGFRLAARGRRTPAVPESARCLPLSAEVPEAPTRALVRCARREGVGLNSVLNAAQLTAVWRRLYGGVAGPLRFVTFADLRPYLEPAVDPETTGSYFSMLRFTVRMQPGAGLWPLARRVSEQIQRAFRRDDKLIAPLLSPSMMRMILRLGTVRMASVALSYSGLAPLQPSPGAAPLRGVHAFISNLRLGPEFTAQVRLFEGRLCWDMVVLDGDMDRACARGIADEIVAVLRAAAEE